MASRDYVVIPTGFVVAYRSSKGEYIAVSEHQLPSSAEAEAKALNAAAAAETAKTKDLIAAGMTGRRMARQLEAME